MLKVKFKNHSSFNDKQHFIRCLKDLILEWEDIIGAKEMNKEDVGFNYERLEELKSILNKE